ncbi:MAG: hypothetical protein IT562_23570 [Alphaproteobacteria bacterium]|nr:hypothetical protein [Alphaproteobacteria bacterium]
MLRTPIRAALAALLAAALAPAAATPARAEAATYRFQKEAQDSCPGDQVVWLNAESGTYYRRGQNAYASTRYGAGGFVCRADAEKNKHKPGADFGQQDSGQQNFRMIEPPPKKPESQPRGQPRGQPGGQPADQADEAE